MVELINWSAEEVRLWLVGIFKDFKNQDEIVEKLTGMTGPALASLGVDVLTGNYFALKITEALHLVGCRNMMFDISSQGFFVFLLILFLVSHFVIFRHGLERGTSISSQGR
jgi:hypothetical protein